MSQKSFPDTTSESTDGPPVRGRKGGLGRGLGALIPSYPDAEPRNATLDVDINAIAPNPYQPRTGLDPAKLQQLADSIRVHGVIQPLVVRRAEERDRYTLIAGERRWRAARLAGLTVVSVVVKEAAPQAMLELALVENVGRSRVSITNTLRLLTAPEQVQTALQEGRITEGHARALLGLPNAADQVAMLEVVIAKGWTVRQTEDAVRKWVTDPDRQQPDRPQNPLITSLEERFQRALGTRVAVRQPPGASSGTVVIHFYSDEQLQSLYDRLIGEDLV
jgi:ParB family chromosome partitioning protein